MWQLPGGIGRETRLRFARYFVCFAAATVLSGWSLSLAERLNAPVYALVFGAFFAALLALTRPGAAPTPLTRSLRKRSRSFRWALPIVFLAVFLACFLGGLLHPPSNYDYHNYRLPRLLNWLHESGWHWIDTPNQRLNCNGVNSEWLMLPMLLLTGTDRWAFLPNIFAFALFPSAIFTVLQHLGIARRAAWFGMWTISTAYCFVSQAGGTGSDLPSAAFFLLALAFACRAHKTGAPDALMLSVLAMALCTGVKATNLPLLLPWLITVFPISARRNGLVSSKVFATLSVVAICSFLPIAVANLYYSGSWKGKLEEQASLEAGSVVAGAVGNGLAITVGALQPPLLPMPAPLTQALVSAVPDAVENALRRDFPRLKLRFSELPNEENAGIGLGLTVIALASFVAAAFGRSGRRILSPFGWAVCVGNLLALGAYASLSASESAARLLSPYYLVFLAIPFALAGAASLYRRKWWRNLCFCCAASALPIPLLTPSRPVLPVPELADALDFPANISRRIDTVYSVYANRADNLRPLREMLPADAQTIGLIATGDDIETSLWQPFGSERHVTHITPAEPWPNYVQAAVVSSLALSQRYRLDAQQFVSRIDALPDWQLTGTRVIVSKVQEGPVEWTVFTRERPLAETPKETSENSAPKP